MLKLKLQYFGHLMQTGDSLEKTWCWERLRAGGEGDDRGWGGWIALPTLWTWVWASSGSWWWTGKACCPRVHGVTKSRTRLSDWTEHQKIDAFELWCWRRLLRVPWTARRSNQSIIRKSVLNIHWKDWCWSWNSNTLATWCEELTHLKDPDAGKDWGQEEKGMTEDEMVGWHHQLDRHEFG